MKSNFILADVLQKLQVFNPIVIYIDDKLIWDDRKSHEDGWIPYNSAIENYGETWSKTVRHIDIKMIECHHTMLEIFTVED